MAQGERAGPQSIGEFLFNELKAAFQDIRQKVVEEGWFGRVVSPEPVIDMERDRTEPAIRPEEKRPSFEELWGAKDAPAAAPERGIDMDR